MITTAFSTEARATQSFNEFLQNYYQETYGDDAPPLLWWANDGEVAPIKGTAEDDKIKSGRGNDMINGNWGDDRIWDGRGNNTLHGGRDQDRIRGERGNDFLYDGMENDLLYGGEGTDYLDGELGNDRLYGGPGNDWLIGHMGSDYLREGTGSNVMIGGCNSPEYPDYNGGDYKDTFDLKGNRDGDHDIIVAHRNDDIMSQFDGVSNIGINEVSMPSLTINGQVFTLHRSPFDTSAHRVNGADIIYFRETK